MKNILIILAILALALPFAHSQVTVAQVAGSYVEPQETSSMEKITVGGSNYWIIRINGEETFIINQKAEIVKDKAVIEELLINYMKENVNLEQKKTQILGYIEAFNESQYPLREECERTTGVDKMPCDDKESCLKACYAVPLCAMQVRDDLVEAIREWNALRNDVDAAIVNAKQKAGDLNTQQDYEEMSGLIQEMRTAMEEMDAHKIYTIPYCKRMAVDYDSADAAKINADEIATALGGVGAIITRADGIYAKTNERLTYWENRVEMYKQAYSNVVMKYNEVKSLYDKAGFVDGGIEGSLNEAANYSVIMKSLKDEGKYKIAIQQGGAYNATLSNLKISVQTTSAQYDNMKHRAETVLESIGKAKETLNSTAYMANLTLLEDEVNGVLSRKVNKSEINSLSSRMDEIDTEVKVMIANAILEEKSDNGTSGVGGTSATSIICQILDAIKSALGFSVDFLGICK